MALVGASAEPGSVGLWLARNLASGGFAGPVHLVNPHAPVIDGRRALTSVAELPGRVDLAVIAAPPTLPRLVAELGARGACRHRGVRRHSRRPEAGDARRRAAQPAPSILGPNCIGLMVPGAGLNASFSRAAKGDLAFLSQSGALITGILDWAAGRRIGFSHVVSLGDMADVDFGDCLDYLAGETTSRAILLHGGADAGAEVHVGGAARGPRSTPSSWSRRAATPAAPRPRPLIPAR